MKKLTGTIESELNENVSQHRISNRKMPLKVIAHKEIGIQNLVHKEEINGPPKAHRSRGNR